MSPAATVAAARVLSDEAPDHARLTAIALDDVRLLYVPVPKAATTSVLSALADVAGLDPEARLGSRKLEATRSTTVHDGSLWGPEHRLGSRDEDELEWVLRSDDWFRFTVVREPVRRVWSAWVSKVLVRDPRFLASFGEEWFPPVPACAADVVESFRMFVSGLPVRWDWSDSHWSPQVDLIGPGIDYDLVGRLEQFDDVATEVGDYLRSQGTVLPPVGNENPSFLPFSPGLLDREAHDACARWTARDCEAFDYEPLEYLDGGPGRAWCTRVDEALPMIRAITERNVRFLDFWRLHEADAGETASLKLRAATRAAGAIASSLQRLRD
jgi:hypothetical protein